MIRRSLRIPKDVQAIEDPFSQELCRLWNSRDMQGFVFTVRDSENIPVGYALLEDFGRTCTIRGLFVCEDYRRHRVGSRLLHHVLESCALEGRDKLLVNITDGAEKIYEREGFRILGRRVDFPDQQLATRGEFSEEELQKLRKKLQPEKKSRGRKKKVES